MTDDNSARQIRKASLWDALIPVAFLVLSLVASVKLFGVDSSYGPNQIALLLSAGLAMVVAMKNGHRWRDLEKQVFEGMSVVFAPSFILLAVGIMIGTWILAGVVPTMIYFGLQLMHPGIFYVAACLICAVISLSIGSSWTTAASVGVALIGTAVGFGLSVEITAGAVISGAYFGDKMSPLSDTTNLASAVVGVDLFDHIHHMIWTGAPSLLIALLIFFGIGVSGEATVAAEQLQEVLADLQAHFHIAWYNLLPLILLLVLAWKKIPALSAIMLSALLGGVFAVMFQEPVVAAFAGSPERDTASVLLKGVWRVSVGGYEAATGNALLDDLLTGGGAANMLNTIWLILSAVAFGGAMEKSGLLGALIQAILAKVRNTASMIASTVLTGVGANIITGDQYISIVLPGRMYKNAFASHGMAPVNLSRAIEDSATVTSPLVPWNTCGAFMAGALGVATLSYLPFCFFNIAMPLISILYGFINYRIIPLQK